MPYRPSIAGRLDGLDDERDGIVQESPVHLAGKKVLTRIGAQKRRHHHQITHRIGFVFQAPNWMPIDNLTEQVDLQVHGSFRHPWAFDLLSGKSSLIREGIEP